MYIFEKILSYLILILPILIAVAFFTLAERKVMGSIQHRISPNVVGFLGLLQPIADAVKLMLKESVIPTNAVTVGFVVAPVITLFLSLTGWAVLPLSAKSFLVDVDLGLMFLFTVSSLGVYGVILSGWASNSQYAFFGALRSSAQMISYEVSIGLILLIELVYIGSLNLGTIVSFQYFIFLIVPFFPLFIMFLISILAETNRAPFDLPEAESELVSGFNVEYSSMGFALFFLAEYCSMILMCVLTVLLFLGGWLSIPLFHNFIINPLIIGLKTSFLLFFYIWVRASFPRYRVDQLMRLCWKVLLPIALGFIIFTISVCFCSNSVY
jgi:NADH-quinone oxidoreductase subunit H